MSKRLTSPHIWKPEDPVEANARLVLAGMAREYFAEGRQVVAKKTAPAELHPFRLATKRFRYTLEIFRDLYGASIRKKLDSLKPIQDALGDVNDCVATRDAFDAGRKFNSYLKKRSRKKARAFYSAWKDGFDAPGEEAAWLRYLSRIPGRRSSQAKAAIHRQDLAG